MAELEFITPEEARARLLVAYRRSGDESFVETLRRPFLNPVEQRNAAGKRNLHPLLLVAVLLVLAGVSMIFFSFHSGTKPRSLSCNGRSAIADTPMHRTPSFWPGC